jgi:hypothetical protein
LPFIEKGEKMEITITLSDEIGAFLPNSKIPEPSKWAKIVKRVQNDPNHLAGYSQQLKKDMQDFRENFVFSNDHE